MGKMIKMPYFIDADCNKIKIITDFFRILGYYIAEKNRSNYRNSLDFYENRF